MVDISNAQTNALSYTDAAARQIISQMSMREKVFEMHGHGILPFAMSMLFTKKLKPVKAGGNSRFHIPSAIFIDGPRGMFHYKGATAFPVTMARGASWDRDLEERVGEAIAKETRALGGNYSGAVCMNLLRHPAWGRAQETYGEDPYHVGEMASALVDGIQKHNVQACAKHFAANSMENNRFGGNIKIAARALREVYLPHFKKVVQHGVASIMSAYNKLNGEYCGESKALLTHILRTEWGFKGYITSDWMYGVFDAQKGIEAGMNVEMPLNKVYNLKAIKKLISNGNISEKQIDELVLPIIRTKLNYALKKDTITYSKKMLGCKEHIALAREVAEKSAVLLKNENNTLPLDKNTIKQIAVIGSLSAVKQTGDHGSSLIYPSYIISPLEGITNYFAGTDTKIITAPVNDLQAIKNICEKADAVIIVAGTTYLDEGEYISDGVIRDKNNPNKQCFATRSGVLGLGGDRQYLHLHQPDINAIKAAAAVNKKVIVSLVAGSAITVEEWQGQAQGILQIFYNGMEGGNALARIIFGDVNPSGKLPFTVPVSESELPPFDSYAANVEYGYYHGYTLYDKEKKTPRYPFGFGLSYTTFNISKLHITQEEITDGDSLQITVSVKNTGIKAGAEVVQLYVNFANKKVDMPEKLLRGFEKIFLEPGQQQVVHFALTAQDLAYYNTDASKWETEKGSYSVSVGNSSNPKGFTTAQFTFK